jgi:hypothetical protein
VKVAVFTPHGNENLSPEQCLNQEKGLKIGAEWHITSPTYGLLIEPVA